MNENQKIPSRTKIKSNTQLIHGHKGREVETKNIAKKWQTKTCLNSFSKIASIVIYFDSKICIYFDCILRTQNSMLPLWWARRKIQQRWCSCQLQIISTPRPSGRMIFFVEGSYVSWLWSFSRNFEGFAKKTKKTQVFLAKNLKSCARAVPLHHTLLASLA